MKKYFSVLGLFICFLSQSALARENAGITGASTLTSGTFAATVDVGLDLIPEPLLYGVRFDAGLGDRFQVGIGGSYFWLVSGAGLYLKGNVWRSADEKNYLSISANPSFVHFDDFLFQDSSIWVSFFKSSVDYERRLGAEKRTAWYVRLGGLKALSLSDKQSTDFIADEDATSIFLESGLESHFSKHISGFIELGQYVPVAPDFEMSKFGIHGKAGISFLF